MNLSPSRCNVFLFVLGLFLIQSPSSHAHFPWLIMNDEGHALLFFSESPLERDYHLPESVAQAKIKGLAGNGKSYEIELSTVEEDDFIGRRSAQPVTAGTGLASAFQYGIYHGTLLQYYAQHLPSLGEKRLVFPESHQPQLNSSIESTKTGLELTVLWKGAPLRGASVTLIDANDDRVERSTDATGNASFATPVEGMTGFVIGHVAKGVEGDWQGESYSGESHYLTLTTVVQGQAEQQSSRYADLPEAVASFGAAVCDGWLYVYSGHTGEAHDHSRENLSQSFRRLRLGDQGKWEELPMQTPLQGLPLVSHKGRLYRVGGLKAANSKDEDEDLHSVDEFCRFDPETNEWKTLPNLPEKTFFA